MSNKQKNKTSSKANKQPKQAINFYWVTVAIIVIITFFTYRDALQNPFMISWDDNMHVVDNKDIQSLDATHLKAIFTPNIRYMYHPITMLSFAIDYSFGGLNAKTFHLTNLLIHLLNIVLVFLFVNALTKQKLIGLIAAFVFALHPMQVEAVAWISERKDVLYAAFMLGALITYLKFKSTQQIKFFYYTMGFFIGSLLSKPAAIPLPLILLGIDYYQSGSINKKQLINKIPFFALSILFGILPFIMQKSSGDLQELATTYTIIDRLFLASYAVLFYIIKFILPINLSPLYYLPEKINGWFHLEYYLAPLAIIGIAILLIYLIKKDKREIVMGFILFICAISLVLQIIPIGRIITADRYTYVPFIGLSIVAGHLISTLIENKKSSLSYIVIGFGILAIVYVKQSNARIQIWQNGITLFSDVIEQNPEKPHAWAARAYAKLQMKDFEGSIADYNKALALKFIDAEAINNKGNAYYELKNYEEAIANYKYAIQVDSTYALPYYNMAQVLEITKPDYRRSIALYTKAIELDSAYMLAYNARGMAYFKLNSFDTAMINFDKAIAFDSTYPNAWHNKGLVLFTQKKYPESILFYNKAIEVYPGFGLAYSNRAVSKYYINQRNEACMDWQLALQNGHADAQNMITTYCR